MCDFGCPTVFNIPPPCDREVNGGVKICSLENPSRDIDYLSRIMSEHHRRITQTEREEKKMKVSYTTITEEGKTKREYTGELESLVKSEKPYGGYSLAIRQEDGSKVEFGGIGLKRLRFLGGSFGFEEE